MPEPRRPKILLVEDEPRVAGFVVKGLRADGAEVVLAEDGDVGLFLATSDAFDCLVLDLGLPGLSGLELLRRLRIIRPRLPVIMLTARDEPEARTACLAAGADHIVTKPFSVQDLRDRVRASLAPVQNGG